MQLASAVLHCSFLSEAVWNRHHMRRQRSGRSIHLRCCLNQSSASSTSLSKMVGRSLFSLQCLLGARQQARCTIVDVVLHPKQLPESTSCVQPARCANNTMQIYTIIGGYNMLQHQSVANDATKKLETGLGVQ